MNFISFSLPPTCIKLAPVRTKYEFLKPLIMKIKLAMLMVLIAFVHVSAKSSAQISMKLDNVPFNEALTAIQNKSGYIFFYKAELLAYANPVSLEVRSAGIDKLLSELFNTQPQLTYRIIDKTIVLSKKKPVSSSEKLLAKADSTINLSGLVYDERGKPLPGASIKIAGSDLVIMTDQKGEFKLISPSSRVLITVSYVGYKPFTAAIVSKQHFIRIVMELNENNLDNVQIIGYGTTTKRLSTGNVSTITAKDIEEQPVTNPILALEGRVPGLFITQASGTPGSGVNITLRAAASLASGTTPLFIIDGVSYSSDPLYTAGGNPSSFLRPAGGTSPLNSINPSDIESISILKDADATAIYGSRGANGVILITTKKGKSTQTTVNASFSKGMSTVPSARRAGPVSLDQYLEVRRRAYANSGITPTAVDAPDLLSWSQTESTDWQKLLFGKTAGSTDLTASISGGSNQTSFLISGVYHDEGQVTPGDFSYQRGGIHMNISHEFPNRKFGIDGTVTFNMDKNAGALRPNANTDIANIAFQAPPNYPIYDPSGKLYWVNPPSTFTVNPLSFQYRYYEGKTNNLVGNINMHYQPVENLTIRLSSSYNRNQLYQRALNYSASINPNSTTRPSANFQENYTSSWNLEPQAEYAVDLGGGKLNLLAGGTLQSNAYVQPYSIIAQNFSSDNLLSNFTSAASYTAYSFDSYYKYASAFGRINYNWNNKYLANINYRWDTSSKFGVNNRSGSFYSVGGAWILSEEKLIKDALPWLSFAKIRSSYGRTGNDQIGNYQFYDTYTTSFYSYDNTAGIYPNNVANPNLKWEVNKKFEAAMDLSFLNNRISISGSYFINTTNNPLVSFPLASMSGFTSYTANMPATIRSQGPEFELTTENIKGKNFSWTTSFNISAPQNKLVSFPDIRNTGYVGSAIVGESLNSVRGFNYTGIDPATSLPSFQDANGDGISNFPQTQLAAYGLGDYVTIGKTNPAFFGGMNNTFNYKNFQLSFFIQFSGKRMIQGLNHANYNGQFPIGFGTTNFSSSLYDLYQQTGGKLATATANFVAGTPYIAYYMYTRSSGAFSNAAFARLKTVSLSYKLPVSWMEKIHLTNCQVFARGQNLFTVTDFDGYDPETPASNIPPVRTIIFGINCSF